MDFYISVALIVISVVLTYAVSLPILKILQLSGYKASGVFAWWKATKYDSLIRYASLTMFGFVAVVVFCGCFSAYEYARYCAVALYIALSVVFVVAAFKSGCGNVKYTGRLKRLIVAATVLNAVIGGGAAVAAYFSPYCQTLVALLGIFAPFTVMAANAIMSPFEKLNNKKYIKRAKQKLADLKPIVIGITGSYGKTTAKNILCAMLSAKDSVLATPGSFNTPMGVCKTINDMLNGQKYLIAEMGARYPGDISELCEIVSPSVAIITAIGDMHIETLGSREGVANAKYEIATGLTANGLLVLNGYNADCAALKNRSSACEVLTAGESITYDNYALTAAGSVFDLNIDGTVHNVTTRLLGAHIPELVCVCAAAALRLGALPEDIVAAVKSIEPVEHRLQLLPSSDSSVTVIDDAYNSNPAGAKNALDVLAGMPGKKIIITPGFVELGAIEKECNTALGGQIAAVCDYAYLVGSRAEDIRSGALKAGMADGCISVFSSRDEAVEALKIVSGERTVLFENDLPDNIK